MAEVDLQIIKEQVRQASDIVEVIGSYVPLKQAGRSFKGLSPFNKEKTPSFMVDPGKQLFYCFSSHQGGDVFKFVELYENLDFMGALRRLAERAGIEIPERSRLNGAPQVGRSVREELYRLHEAVAAWWAELLHKDPSPGAQKARDYLKSREFGAPLAKQFQVGYAPEGWDATLNWARKNRFSLEVIDQSGLVTIQEEKQSRYDRFRGRLMFPICNEIGKVVAFSGRLLDADAKAAKYVNSPETPIFVKSKTLFGLDKARQAIRDEGFVVLCEGQIDMIRCFERGIRNVVASQGTAFNQEHARLMGRFAEKVVICYDADRAGQKAALGSSEKLLEEGFDVRIASMPPGEDPDSLLRKQGVEVLKEIIARAPDYTRHTLDAACKENDITTPRGRGLVAERMAAVVAKIPNTIQRERLSLEVASRLEVPLAVFHREVEKAGKPGNVPASQENRDGEAGAGELPFVADAKIGSLLALCLHHPELVPQAQQRLHPEWIAGFDGGALLNRLLTLHGEGAWVDENDFMAGISESERNFVARLLLEPITLGEDLNGKTGPEPLFLDVADKLGKEWKARRLRTLEQEIKSGLLTPEQFLAKSKALLDLKRSGP